MVRDPHIAFVLSHPYVDALACFREPIKCLADCGWHVDLYTTLSPEHSVPNFHRAEVRLRPIEITRAGALRLLWQLVSHRPRYRWIFTVPQWDLHYAGMAARLARIPIACISDELIAEAELATRVEKKWKERERRAHQRCAFTIALSDERADFIRAENRLGPAHRIFVVPNSPPGPAERLQSHYYQDTLRLPSGRRVLLHAGSLWWQPARDLIDAASTWSSEWVVVFQGRTAGQLQAREDSDHVRFSRTVLPNDLLDYAVSSAHIGLALYPCERANDRLMGTASGKIGLYMKNALPVIALDHESFQWIEREGCGLCVRSVRDAQAAAEAIWRHYDRYVDHVKRRYAVGLDFRERFRPVLSAIS